MVSGRVAAGRSGTYLVFGFVLTVAGCSGADSPAFVTGKVVHRDGSPLVNGRLLAKCEETGKAGSGITDVSGQYEMMTARIGDGIPAGKYHVAIVEDLGDQDHRNPPTVAAKYRNPATSGLEFTLKAGDRTVFDAKLDPP